MQASPSSTNRFYIFNIRSFQNTAKTNFTRCTVPRGIRFWSPVIMCFSFLPCSSPFATLVNPRFTPIFRIKSCPWRAHQSGGKTIDRICRISISFNDRRIFTGYTVKKVHSYHVFCLFLLTFYGSRCIFDLKLEIIKNILNNNINIKGHSQSIEYQNKTIEYHRIILKLDFYIGIFHLYYVSNMIKYESVLQ